MPTNLDLLQQLTTAEPQAGPAQLSCAGFTCLITGVPTVIDDEG